MQILSHNNLVVPNAIHSEESHCIISCINPAITCVALAALAGIGISLATGNFVAAAVCASILCVTVIVGIGISCFKNQENPNNEIPLFKPAADFHPQQPKPLKKEFVLPLEDQLDPILLENAKLLVDQAKRGLLPTAKIGVKSDEIFMPELPVVIRMHHSLEERLISIGKARKVIVDNELSHIVVPRATLHDKVLFEERVDAINHRIAMAHYYLHPELFNDSAPEFAVFLSKCNLSDIVGGNKNIKESVWPNGEPRYDNVMLLKSGEISPIDLDTFDTKSEVRSDDYVKAGVEAITLFPFQYEQIVSKLEELQGRSFHPSNLVKLKKHRDIALNGFEEDVGKHYRFLQEKLLDENSKTFEISPEIYEDLRVEMQKALSELNVLEDSSYLGENPEPILVHFDTFVLPHMVEFIKETMNPLFEEISLNELEINPKLLSKRVFVSELPRNYGKYLNKNSLRYHVDRDTLSDADKKIYYYKLGLEEHRYSFVILNILIDKLINAGLIANRVSDPAYYCTTIYF